MGEAVLMIEMSALTKPQAENSDVFPFGSVAVAVMNCPLKGLGVVKVKFALQFPSVVTGDEPMNVWPPPKPEGSRPSLEKNSRVKVVLGALFNVPCIVVLPAELETEVSTGKF